MSGRNRGQSLVEYAVLAGVLVGAVLAFESYVRRGLQARYKTLANGVTQSAGAPPQYEPYYVSATSITTQDTHKTDRALPGGAREKLALEVRALDPGATQHVGVNLSADDEWQ